MTRRNCGVRPRRPRAGLGLAENGAIDAISLFLADDNSFRRPSLCLSARPALRRRLQGDAFALPGFRCFAKLPNWALLEHLARAKFLVLIQLSHGALRAKIALAWLAHMR